MINFCCILTLLLVAAKLAFTPWSDASHWALITALWVVVTLLIRNTRRVVL